MNVENFVVFSSMAISQKLTELQDQYLMIGIFFLGSRVKMEDVLKDRSVAVTFYSLVFENRPC